MFLKNTLKDFSARGNKFRAVYFLPFIAYSDWKNSIENGIYFGWLIWLLYIPLKRK